MGCKLILEHNYRAVAALMLTLDVNGPLRNIFDPKFSRFHALFYRPQRSCGQGNVFTGVCLSTGGGGGEGVCLSACLDAITPPPDGGTPPDGEPPPRGPGRPPPDGGTPPDGEPPPRDQADPPGTRQTPPWMEESPRMENLPPPPRTRQTPPRGTRQTPREADSSIRSTSGRYASYWNAFLFLKI